MSAGTNLDLGAQERNQSQAASQIDRASQHTQLEMVGAVASGHGLRRVAQIASEATGAPVCVIVPRLENQDSTGLSLERYVAARLGGGQPRRPDEVVAEVPISWGREDLGAVLMLAPGCPGPGDFDCLRAAATAALAAVAVRDAREDSERRLRGSFLEELRTRDGLSADYIVRHASRLGCDLSNGAVALCAAPANRLAGHLVATITTECEGSLAQEFDGRVYALLPGSLESARQVAKRASRNSTVGISSHYLDPAELRRAFEEAELVLEVTASGGTVDRSLTDDGTYRLLFRVLVSSPKEVGDFYEETVAPLVRYDEQYRSSDLLGTLVAYLEHDCNVSATASALYAHRHTISYRLERIRELTGLDPFSSRGRESLGLGLKARHIIGSKAAS
jgi:PucR C-terminal helix-turn-helix domain/GGDEF-like domain